MIYQTSLGSAEWIIRLSVKNGKISFSGSSRGYEPDEIIPKMAKKVKISKPSKADDGRITQYIEFECATDGDAIICRDDSNSWNAIS